MNEIKDVFDIKVELGAALKELRVKKGLTQEDLKNEFLSRNQISNIEKGKQSTTFEKILYFMDTLNLTFDELMFFLDDEYHSFKTGMITELSKYSGLGGVEKLKGLQKKALRLYEAYGIDYFQFMAEMAASRIVLIQENNNFENARKEVSHLADYFHKIKSMNYNDLRMLGECLFILEIDTALEFIQKALTVINNYYDFYRNKRIGSALCLNMAIYALDFPTHWHYALEYSQKAMELSSTGFHLHTTLKAKVVYQVACYKIGNGKYDETLLKGSLDAFKLAEWNSQYQQVAAFIKKHGLSF